MLRVAGITECRSRPARSFGSSAERFQLVFLKVRYFNKHTQALTLIRWQRRTDVIEPPGRVPVTARCNKSWYRFGT